MHRYAKRAVGVTKDEFYQSEEYEAVFKIDDDYCEEIDVYSFAISDKQLSYEVIDRVSPEWHVEALNPLGRELALGWYNDQDVLLQRKLYLFVHLGRGLWCVGKPYYESEAMSFIEPKRLRNSTV